VVQSEIYVVTCRGGFRLSCSMPLVTIDNGSLPSKYPIHSRNPPSVFLSDSADRHFCRGGFSHANATLFGSISSAKQ